MLKEIKEVFSEVHHLLWHNRLAVKRAYDLSDDEKDDQVQQTDNETEND